MRSGRPTTTMMTRQETWEVTITTPGNTQSVQPGEPAAPILVVDDDRNIREMLRWALEEEGLGVETAADGREALERLEQRQPSLMLLDITLPVLGGVEVARGLRARYGDAVPIVAITADGHAAEKARQVGAVSYFHKPFQVDALLDTIRELLEHEWQPRF